MVITSDMRTYFKILSYAKPLGKLMSGYFISTLLNIVFGLVNFSLLIPLFEILFDKNKVVQHLQAVHEFPKFQFNLRYCKEVFYHYYCSIIQKYGDLGALYSMCLFFLVAVFTANLFRYLAVIIMAKIRIRTICALRQKIFQKIMQLHLGYFTHHQQGYIISKATHDVHEVEYFVVNSLKSLFKDPIQIISFFVVLFYLSYQLTLFTILILPVAGFCIGKIVKSIRKKAKKGQESMGRIVSILHETLFGIRIIKAFTAQKNMIKKFKKENDHYARTHISISRRHELSAPISEFFGVLVVVIILGYGGRLVLQAHAPLSASEFMVYIILFSQVISPAKSIVHTISNMQRGLAAAHRVFDLINTKPLIQDHPTAKTITHFSEKICFHQVTFAYEKQTVLQNIDLTISKGKTIALVGPSGGGKSTLVDLIPRFYTPQKGYITIDGQRLENYTLQSLRSLMGIVTQESILFHDTVWNNIIFGHSLAVTESQVVQAAQMAYAHDFIMQLPQGYQTLMGERGIKLSGGQRQRICIARALLKNPPILILDEATSALDTASEKWVQEALDCLMKNRTVIVIAHRLSTIQQADEIVVIDQGKIIERGKHAQLMQKKGLYQQLREGY